MNAPEPEDAIRAAIRSWSRPTDLAQFAARRHGFGNTDVGFDVTYPNDLDEYERGVDGVPVHEGFVRVYGFWGPPNGDEVLVPEVAYLDALADILSAAGHSAEGERVRALAQKQRATEPFS